MCIFQSEQVIKLRFLLKNNLADIWVARWDLNPLDYHVRYNTGTFSKPDQYFLFHIYAKTNQNCRAEDCLASIWNDLPQEFTD